MMRHDLRRWLIALCVLIGCTDSQSTTDTQVTVRLYNDDAALLSRMSALRVSFSLQTGSSWRSYPEKIFKKEELTWPVDIPIVPSRAADAEKSFEVVIDTLEGDSVLAQARATSSFGPGTVRILELWLYRCPGHEDGFVCAQPQCTGGACSVCLPDGSCAQNVISPAKLLPFDPTMEPVSKPVPDWMANGGSAVGSSQNAGSAVDANLCNAERAGCDAHARCVLENGVPTCRCTGNYTGDGRTCTFSASCASLQCDETSACTLRTGSVSEYQCACLKGYEPSASGTCQDIDECSRTPAVCGDTKDCSNTVGGYTCKCKSGFALKTDGVTCAPIESCSTSSGEPRCLNGGACNAGQNGYSCSCAGTGFSGPRCQINDDDCSPNPCMNGGTCVDGVKAFTCGCPDGYMGPRCETAVTHTLKVSTSAAVAGASGSVSGGGISCPGTCSATAAHGTSITLTAIPKPGYYFGGWSGGCTGGSLSCTVALGADVNVVAVFTKANIAFTTSTTYKVSDLAANDPSGGRDPVKGADRLCQVRAAASTNAEVRARTFRSLISNQADSLGADRVSGFRGWIRPDGKPVGDEFAAFSTPKVTLYYPLSLDENGTAIASDSVEVALGNGCKNWTSQVIEDYRQGGVLSAGGYGWDSAFGTPCVYDLRLYCFSVDYVATVTAPGRPANAKIAFVTDGKFTPAGSSGIAAADALCQAEAAAASLSGNFRALLGSASPAYSAISRFSSSGPWVRMDGVSIGSYANLAASPPTLLATIAVTPTMNYLGSASVWTGVADGATVPTAEISCTPSGGASFTGGASLKGNAGRPYMTNNYFFNSYDPTTCNTAMRLLCLQQ